MTINKTITAITFATLLASGSAFANPDNETDVLHGGAWVGSTQSQDFERRTANNEQQGDQLYDSQAVAGVSELSPFERISANPDISTDLIYGS